MYKKKLVALLISVVLAGCGLSDDIRSIADNSQRNLIWVWAQFNVPIEKHDISTYYYFGRIPQKFYDKIASNEMKSGFIVLRDVRYWGNDDLIHAFKDRQNTGDILFRIEDLRRLELVANEPMVGRGNEQYNDPEPASTAEQSESSSASSSNSSK